MDISSAGRPPDLGFFTGYLKERGVGDVVIVGIQPAAVDFSGALSPPVRKAPAQLQKIFRSHDTQRKRLSIPSPSGTLSYPPARKRTAVVCADRSPPRRFPRRRRTGSAGPKRPSPRPAVVFEAQQ